MFSFWLLVCFACVSDNLRILLWLLLLSSCSCCPRWDRARDPCSRRLLVWRVSQVTCFLLWLQCCHMVECCVNNSKLRTAPLSGRKKARQRLFPKVLWTSQPTEEFCRGKKIVNNLLNVKSIQEGLVSLQAQQVTHLSQLEFDKKRWAHDKTHVEGLSSEHVSLVINTCNQFGVMAKSSKRRIECYVLVNMWWSNEETEQ